MPNLLDKKNVCPLSNSCPVYFAKEHADDYPNFFINPCWEMKSCICSIRKTEGCKKCARKTNDNPLC